MIGESELASLDQYYDALRYDDVNPGVRHKINAGREPATAVGEAVATLHAFYCVAGRATNTDSRSAGLNLVRVLIAALADQAGHRAHAAFEQTHAQAVGLRFVLVELILFDFHRGVGPQCSRTAI